MKVSKSILVTTATGLSLETTTANELVLNSTDKRPSKVVGSTIWNCLYNPFSTESLAVNFPAIILDARFPSEITPIILP